MAWEARHVRLALDELKTQLTTAIPTAIDDVRADTGILGAAVVSLTNFVANTSQHGVTVNGSTYGGSTTGATQQAVLTTIGGLIEIGESGVTATQTGTGSSAILTLTSTTEVTASPGTNTAVDSSGEDPTGVDIRQGDDRESRLVRVTITVEGQPDHDHWMSHHVDLEIPLLVTAYMHEGDDPETQERHAWEYCRALDIAISRSAPSLTGEWWYRTQSTQIVRYDPRDYGRVAAQVRGDLRIRTRRVEA